MGHALTREAEHNNQTPLYEKAAFNQLYRDDLLYRWSAAFASMWDDIPERGQVILERVAEGEGSTLSGPSRLSVGDRRYLEQIGLIGRDGMWAIDRPFEDWIVENIAVRESRKD